MTATALMDIAGDLTRIAQTLHNSSAGGEDSIQIASAATDELGSIIARARGLAEQYVPDLTTSDADT